MVRIAILGATGYTALELLKLLLRHPQADIVAVTSRNAGQALETVHPQLTGRLDLDLEDLSTEQIADRADCVFSCLPHAASAEIVGPLVDAGLKVVDFSADYRLRDVATYEEWYGGTHPDPERVGTTPYGLPEWFGQQIKGASLVANPGCYPTSAILALAPLLKAGLVASTGIIVDSKSGVSGAGRTPKLATHFPECNESISAYGLGNHRHTPEITQILAAATGSSPEIVFTPHLVPMNRGILTTTYSAAFRSVSERELFELYRACYDECPFVRVVAHLPSTRDVVHTNYCDITLRVVKNHVVAISCEDNLIKGASGAAVQNFNLMFGFPETTAL
jgi:N-acetyl-gamma-glutamyl-phosphate reductase